MNAAIEQDATLIEQYQSGSIDAYGQLYDRYIRKIYDFIYYRTSHRETAEDLTSHTFTKALEKLAEFDVSKGTFQSWIFRIARNTVIDYYRTHKRTDDIDAHFDIHSSQDIAGETDIRRTLESVQKYLEKLTEEQREIITLRVYSGLSYREIARVIGKTEAAAKMTFSRTIGLLRQELSLVIFVAAVTIFKV